MGKKNSISLGLYEKAFPIGLPIKDEVNAALSSGFDYLEISVDRTDSKITRIFSDSFLFDCMGIFRERGAVIRSLCLSALSTYTLGSLNKEVVSKALCLLERTLFFAEKTGVRVIQIPFCDIPKNLCSSAETKQEYLKNILKVNQIASGKNVKIAFENMETSGFSKITDIRSFLRKIPDSRFWIYPDVGNIEAAFDYDLSASTDDLSLCSSATFGDCIHLKETKPGKYGGLYYGDGKVEFNPLVKKCVEMKKRNFVLEYWYLNDRDPYEYMAKEAKRFKKMIGIN